MSAQIGIRLLLEGAAQAEAGIQRVRGAVTGLAGAFAGAFSAGAFIRAADSITLLNNQLKLATGSAQAAATASAALFDIAQRSSVSFTELGTTFAAITRAGDALGLSQNRLLNVAESISNALALSGGQASSMQAALVQLSQGLSSGVLRGEELNSIMEQTPRLARAIADGLNVPIGKLREMGQAGQLTSEQVIKSLESQYAKLRDEVANGTLTVGNAMTQISNAAVKAAGEFDKASGATAGLVSVLLNLSGAVSTMGRAFAENETVVKTTLGTLAGVATAAGIAATVSSIGGMITAAGGLTAALAATRAGFVALTATMLANPFGLIAIGIGAATGALIAYNSAQAGTATGMRKAIMDMEAANNGLLNLKGQAGMTPSERVGYEERLGKIAALKASLVELDRAFAAKNAPIGSAPSGDVALARAQNAERAIRQANLAKIMGDLATPQENLNKALADARQKLGDLYTPEIEARIRERFIKPTKAGAAATDELAVAAERGAKALAAMVATDAGLSPDFASDWSDLAAAFQKGRINLEQLTSAQASLLAQQPAMVEAARAQAAASEQLALAEAERIEAVERSADSVADRLQQLQDEERALAVAAAQNISLAQAVEEVAIARLREQQAALMREGEIDGGLRAIQREIDARKQLASAIGTRDVREASEKSAKDAADDWKKTAESIEKDLTDALMRGFEDGKGFAKNLRDTLVNMFKTMVLRPTISAILAPVAGAISGTANAAGGGAGGALGTASNLLSFANLNTAGAFGGLFASSAAYGAAIGTSSFAAGSQAAMLAAQTGTFGAAGLTATSTAAAGAGAGAASSLAAAGPYIAAALVLYSILSKKTPGEQATGGFFSTAGRTGFDAAAAITGSRQGETRDLIDRNNPALQSAVASGAQAVVGSLTSLAASLGQKMNLALDLGFAANTNGKGADKNAFGYFGISDGSGTLLETSQNRKLGEDSAKAFEQLLQDATNALAKQILVGNESLMRAGETASGTLTRLSTSLTTVNAAFDSLGAALYATSLAGADMASSLVDAFGGMDAFAGATSSYYEAFYSEQERTETALRQLSNTLGQLGLALPDAAAADALAQYRALADAQDLNTEAGRTGYAALVTLGSGFAQLVTSTQSLAQAAGDATTSVDTLAADLKQQASIRAGLERDLLELQGNTAALRLLDIAGMNAENVALFDRIAALRQAQLATASAAQAERDLIQARNATAQAAYSDAQAATAAAQALLDRSAQAERASIASARAAVDATKSAAQSVAQEIRGVFDTLSSSLRDLYADVSSTAAMGAATGRAFLNNALASARTTGYLPDGKALSDAIGAVRGGMGDEQYASAFERDRDRLLLAAKLSELAGIAEPQLSAAEQAIKLADAQLKQLDQQTEALDDLLRIAKDELDALRGINTGTTSVASAIDALRLTVIAELQAQTAALGASLIAAISAGTMRPQDAVKQYEKQTGAMVARDQWIDAAGTQAYVSAGGAVALAGSAANGVVPADARAAAIYGTQGQQTTIGDASDFISAAMASGDLRSIYDAARAYGISSGAVDALGGFAPGTAAAWAAENKLPQFAAGINRVPYDMTARVHADEAIIPAAFNPFNPNAQGGMGGNTDRLERLVEGLTAEVQRLQEIGATGNRHAERTAVVLDDAARGKQPLSTAA